MERILTGLIFILLSITICPAHNIMIGILPDFIGYYFLVSGLRRVEQDSESLAKAKPVAVLMGIYTTVAYISNIFAGEKLSKQTGMLMVNAFTLAALLYILYKIISGIEELQEKHQIHSSSPINIMKWQWRVIAAGRIIIYLLSALELAGHGNEKISRIVYSPLSGAMSTVYYILVVIISIVSLSFMVEFNENVKTGSLYHV